MPGEITTVRNGNFTRQCDENMYLLTSIFRVQWRTPGEIAAKFSCRKLLWVSRALGPSWDGDREHDVEDADSRYSATPF